MEMQNIQRYEYYIKLLAQTQVFYDEAVNKMQTAQTVEYSKRAKAIISTILKEFSQKTLRNVVDDTAIVKADIELRNEASIIANKKRKEIKRAESITDFAFHTMSNGHGIWNSPLSKKEIEFMSKQGIELRTSAEHPHIYFAKFQMATQKNEYQNIV